MSLKDSEKSSQVHRDDGYQLAGKDLSAYFCVKANKKKNAIDLGRHPSSLPKDSEMWHYSALSTQRRNRIKKGHKFWDVVEEENVETTIPDKVAEEVKDEHDEYNEVSKDLHFLKGSSINAKLRNFLRSSKNNDMQHLELRVDFKNKNQIYYGMSFVIMNYAEEILYVNKKDELRCKPASMIEPSDRIKFKMIDLLNPSNPQPLKFGDPMYLQCLDVNENADNSFHVGYVLSAKLFGLPQHNSLNFDASQIYTTTDSGVYNNNSSSNDAAAESAGEGGAAAPLQQQQQQSRSKKSVAGLHGAEAAGGNGSESGTGGLTIETSDLKSSGSGSHDAGDQEDKDVTKQAHSGNHMNTSPYGMHTPNGSVVKSNSGQEFTTPPKPDQLGRATSFSSIGHQRAGGDKASHNAAMICGDVHMTRIVEMKQVESALGFSVDFSALMSDDKAMRYTSKTASLLGKWSIHSAELETSPTKLKTENSSTQDAKATGMLANNADSSMGEKDEDPHVYSCSPIFIQQDLYCISTKQANEHRKWPMRSGTIINHSENIAQTTAKEYRQAYRESAVVKNALQIRANKRASTRLYEDDDLVDEKRRHRSHHSHHHRHHHNHHQGNRDGNISSNSSATGTSTGTGAGSSVGQGAANSPGNSSTGMGHHRHHDHDEDDHDVSDGGARKDFAFGCLRKVVKRGPPYDFSVDRRCVWKFCLFEQFSDNNIKLSVKDRAAKKVMETATMAMKLSQLNREGAHTHIQNHTYGEDLPPLKSGETFVKTLREINHKTSMKIEEKYLAMRRAKEARLRDHFARHITEVMHMEKVDEASEAARRKFKGGGGGGGRSSGNSTPKNSSQIMPAGESLFLTEVGAAAGDDSKGTSAGGGASPLKRSISLKYVAASINAFSSAKINSKSSKGVTFSAGDGDSVGGVSSLGGSASLDNLTISEDSVHHAFTPTENVPNLMHKPLRRRTSFLIDSVPSGKFLKDYTTGGQGVFGAGSGSGEDGSASNAAVPGGLAKLVSINNAKAAGPSGGSSGGNGKKTAPDTAGASSATATTTSKNTLSNAGTRAAGPGGGIPQQLKPLQIKTHSNPGFITNKSMSEFMHAAQMAESAVAALPDNDKKALAMDNKLHLDPTRLWLDNPKALHQFDDLSAGEKVLALHKTFYRVEDYCLDPARILRRQHLGLTTSNAGLEGTFAAVAAASSTTTNTSASPANKNTATSSTGALNSASNAAGGDSFPDSAVGSPVGGAVGSIGSSSKKHLKFGPLSSTNSSADGSNTATGAAAGAGAGGGMVNQTAAAVAQRNRAMAANIQKKLSRLKEEDENLLKVLHFKERRDRMRKKEDLYEYSSGV